MSDELVIDASALVDALVGEDAEAIVDTVAGQSMLAPAHLDAEVLSALRGLRLGGQLSLGRCRDALTDPSAAAPRFSPSGTWTSVSTPMSG